MKKLLAIPYGIWMIICMILFIITFVPVAIIASITWRSKWFWFFFQVGTMQNKIKEL